MVENNPLVYVQSREQLFTGKQSRSLIKFKLPINSNLYKPFDLKPYIAASLISAPSPTKLACVNFMLAEGIGESSRIVPILKQHFLAPYLYQSLEFAYMTTYSNFPR